MLKIVSMESICKGQTLVFLFVCLFVFFTVFTPIYDKQTDESSRIIPCKGITECYRFRLDHGDYRLIIFP